MGVPQSIRDDEITCQLTHFPGSAQRTAALKMQIRLARIYADIARSRSCGAFTVFPTRSGGRDCSGNRLIIYRRIRPEG